jgi:hypothetical protein
MPTLAEIKTNATTKLIASNLFLNGTLHKPGTPVQDSYGGWTTGAPTNTAVKGIIDTYDELYRIRAGIPDTDVKLLVLQQSVSPGPVQGDTITLRGETYLIRSVAQDPSQTIWEMRGEPI